jgi:glycosyltransferase involved in cell wall biosynthesis
MPKPRISVVTCSYNQGHFIGRTIDSVLSQGYPNLEHVVVDGMSTDDTPQVLGRYPHLRVLREPDRGQADAINKGFRLATGDVLCFLNSDDTLAPGALERVACEIDPGRGRHVVVGRCRFIDEEDRFTGVEHPSAFEGHRRVLEVWKGHALPQPATFWTAEVWRRCGPLDEREQLVLDYDLFCRFSRHYRFHVVDQVLAHYRLHGQSKTCSSGGRNVLEESIRVSKKYWNGLPLVERLRLWASYLSFRLDRRKRAVALLKTARDGWRAGKRLRAAAAAVGCLAFAPDVLTHVILLPELARRRPALFDRLGWLARLCRPPHEHTKLQAWRSFDGVHADGWAGPTLTAPLDVEPGQTELHLEGYVEIGHHPAPLELTLWVDGRPLGTFPVGRRTEFAVAAPLGSVAPGRHELRVEANTFLVAHDFRSNEDFRPLAFKLRGLRLTG